MSHGQPLPKDLDGKNILICDFSFRKNIFAELKKKVNKVLILDHHETAQKDLEDVDPKDKWFDMKHSGAMLTWFYFYPTEQSPLLIKYIEDRDIWTKVLPNTDAFAAWFHTLPFIFEEYIKYFDEKLLLQLIQEKGIPYKELNDHYISQAVDYSVVKFCEIKGQFYFVAFNNSSVLKSDIGNKMFDRYPLCDFSTVYSINEKHDSTSFSLRSTDVHVNVGDVAFSLGSGGHRNSSGLKITEVTNHLPGEVLDKGRLYHQIKNIYFDTLTINDQTTYNIIYFSWSLYKTELATYFLQTKYTNESHEAIQTWKDIAIKTNKSYPESVQLSVVWSHNPADDITEFSVVIDTAVHGDKKYINNWFGLDIDKGLKCKGYHKCIPSNKEHFIYT